MHKFIKLTFDFIIRNNKFFLLVLIPIISLSMHWRVFPLDLMSIHVWRQTQTQTVINNFYKEDFNILNPRINARGDGDGIMRMEFPIMQWIFAGFYKLMGNHLMISRILSFIIGLLSLLGIYKLLFYLFNNDRIAIIGAWCFNFSPSFYYYTVNPLPDNFALCCAIWGLAWFIVYIKKRKASLLVLSCIFLGLSTLAKLPFIIFYSVPFFYFLIMAFKKRIKWETIRFGIISAVSIIPAGLWYLWVIPGWKGNGIVSGVLTNQLSTVQLLDIMQSNLISTLPELLINYGSMLFFISGFYFIIKKRAWHHPVFWPFFFYGALLLLYFLFEMNVISKIHDYYLFPFLPFLFILVAYGAENLLKINRKIVCYITIGLLCILPLFAFLRMESRWRPESPGFNKDLLTYKEELRNLIPGNTLVVAGNDESRFIYLYYIDKKGWVFDQDKLTPNALKNMIGKGAGYLISDSRSINENHEIQKCVYSVLFNKGSIRVYKLRHESL